MIAEEGAALDVPADQLAVAANALTYGIAFQRLVEPDAVPDDLFGNALGLLFKGARA
jgi:hypothetical protein